MATVDANGIAVACDDIGGGDNVLLFVHGHPFNRSMWKPQAAALLEAGWRVVTPDLRGYGDTTVVPGTTTLDVFAHDLAAVLDALGIGRVVIAGLSMGGQIAMEFARLFRPRVSGLVLAATFPRPETDEGKEGRRRMAQRFLHEGMAPYAAEVLPKMVAPRNLDRDPALAAHVLGMMRGTDPAGAAAAVRGRAERPPYEPVLAAFDGPALIVVGDEDAFTTRADAEQMHALLRHSTLMWMEGVGHMPNLERPAAFNAALLRFLDQITDRAAPPADRAGWHDAPAAGTPSSRR